MYYIKVHKALDEWVCEINVNEPITRFLSLINSTKITLGEFTNIYNNYINNLTNLYICNINTHLNYLDDN